MNQIGFNILKRAHNHMRMNNNLETFLAERGLQLEEIKSHLDDYSDIIKEYSKHCIDVSLYEESQEYLQCEFDKLCEFHRRNEERLTNEFFNAAKRMLAHSNHILDDK